MGKASPESPLSVYPRCGDLVSWHFLKCEAITGFTVPGKAHIPGRVEFPFGQAMVGGFTTQFLHILRILTLLERCWYFLLLSLCLYKLREKSDWGGWQQQELWYGAWQPRWVGKNLHIYLDLKWAFPKAVLGSNKAGLKSQWLSLVFTICFGRNWLRLEPQPRGTLVTWSIQELKPRAWAPKYHLYTSPLRDTSISGSC